jgi:uncharacterized protein
VPGLIAIQSSEDGAPSISGLPAGQENPGGAGRIRYSVNDAAKATVKIATAGQTVNYTAEIADSFDEISRGLMYRTSLAPDTGMLFVFGRDENRYFWMENTLIPLDMIYISGDGRVVGVRENAMPRSREAICPPGPCTYVLEVSGGESGRQGICAGDSVTISLT